MKDSFQILDEIRRSVGKPHTSGLSRDILSRFSSDINLQTALEMASEVFNSLDEDQREILNKAEEVNLIELQEGFLNFYNTNSISPYVPLVAKGPWIVSAYGSVIYDTGGYGMLGQGHNPEFATRCLSRSQVMANIMTPSLSQPRFVAALRKEIGRNRVGGCPYGKFISMNSGSEAMSVASRISDLHAGKLISALEINERYTKVTKIVAMRGAFHGRTGRPARASSSSFKAYKKLASFRNYEGTLLVEPNNIEDLERTFTNAKEKNYHIEFIVLEPVMGEGNPGLAITPEFYAAARRLTKECGSLLIIDSIQSGLRTRGELSIVDYPGFETLDPPDMESYSKAINAGQFPVSVLAISKELADIYEPGVYGNTMTANPRALELTCEVLSLMTDSLRANIVSKGKEFKDKLNILMNEYPDKIINVQGTGLLVSAELALDLKNVGPGSIEDKMRLKGVNVIHGGKNALRFTPRFEITSSEIDLIVEVLREQLLG